MPYFGSGELFDQLSLPIPRLWVLRTGEAIAHFTDPLSGWTGKMAGSPIKGNHLSIAKRHMLNPFGSCWVSFLGTQAWMLPDNHHQRSM
jgi:hypothetical protein